MRWIPEFPNRCLRAIPSTPDTLDRNIRPLNFGRKSRRKLVWKLLVLGVALTKLRDTLSPTHKSSQQKPRPAFAPVAWDAWLSSTVRDEGASVCSKC